MLSKKGNELPKAGNFLHQPALVNGTDAGYGTWIADALKRELGTTHRAVKSAMRWTGASERTVKYWFAGSRGPSGAHLIALARHSDAIMEVILRQSGRLYYAEPGSLARIYVKLEELLLMIQPILERKKVID